MKAHFFIFFLMSYFFLFGTLNAQELDQTGELDGASILFQTNQILPIKLSYSNKEIKKNTSDSTYIKTELSFQTDDGTWEKMEIEMRARGNYRRANCYFPPVKLKFKKSATKETVFEGNKKLKLVLPCLNSKNLNDDVIKEFIAYKLYEVISPYYFSTRLVSIDFTEIKNKKTIEHELLGILVEDDKNLAKRFNGKELERFTHPLMQDTISSVQNAMFQFMIANTDFSAAYQHNEKLFLIDGKMVPVPYDFDMSGFVNTSYAVVSEIQNEELSISRVTQRMYRGFKREPFIFEQVRQQFLNKKDRIFELLDSYQNLFSDPKEFEDARDFISGFYEIISDDKKFTKQVVNMGRTK